MNILIVGANSIRCLGVKTIVKRLSEKAVIKHVRCEIELLRSIQFNTFSHIILSTSISKTSLNNLISNVKRSQLAAPILLISEPDEIILPQTFLRSNADGLIAVDVAIKTFENGLESFLTYGNYIPSDLAKEIERIKRTCSIKKKNKLAALSRLQSRVLHHLSTGDKVVHVAAKMGISPSAVSTHKKRAFQKLSISHISEFISITSTNQKFA